MGEKLDNVLVHVIILTATYPPVSHAYRTTADCHSHCFITPHLCLCLILWLLLWASCLLSDPWGYLPASDCGLCFWIATYEAGAEPKEQLFLFQTHLINYRCSFLAWIYNHFNTLDWHIIYFDVWATLFHTDHKFSLLIDSIPILTTNLFWGN